MNIFSLSGKTAFVAGASRGIGLAIAEGVARAGADTILASRNIEALEQNAARLRDEGFKARAVRLDVCDPRFDSRGRRGRSGHRHPALRQRCEYPQALRGF